MDYYCFRKVKAKCPVCDAIPKAYCNFIKDGGSIECWKCRSIYHECEGGIGRTGYSPLNCPYCALPIDEDPKNYIGGFCVGTSS